MTGCSIIYKANSVEDNEPNSFSCKGMPKYFDVSEVNTPHHSNKSMGEPVLVNSSSFKNLETILEQLNENTIKNSEREWLFLEQMNHLCNTQKSFDYFINCKDNHKAW